MQNLTLSDDSYMQSIYSTLNFIRKHPLSSRRPASAVIRYLRWQIESRLRNDVQFRWIEGSKLIVRNGMTGATGNIYCGLHEFADMGFLLHFLRPADLFVDVGANIGSYTILATAVCGASAIAAEPHPGTMASLKRNVEANRGGPLVTLVQAAVGAERGVVQFTMGRDTTNRVTQECDHTIAYQQVQVLPLDAILMDRNPTLIKIDVEGYEPQVLAGATETLRTASLLAILIETVDEIMRGKLAEEGFQEAHYDPFSRRLASGKSQAPLHNTLFVRDFEACAQRVLKAPFRTIAGQVI